LDDRFRPGVADIVARPFAELAFSLELAGIEETLENEGKFGELRGDYGSDAKMGRSHG